MHFIHKLFTKILNTIDPAWGALAVDNEENKMYIKGVVYLGFYYALQLFLYRLPLEATAYYNQLIQDDHARQEFEQVLHYAQFYQLAGAMVGAIVGARWLINHRQKKWKKFNSIRLVLNVSAWFILAGVFLTIYLFKLTPSSTKNYELWMNISRMLFGMGWACGIGCAVIWVCEYLPPHLRLSGALFIGVMGFSGAAMLELGTTVVYQYPESWFQLKVISVIGFAATVFSIIVSRKLPKDSSLNYSYQNLSVEKTKESKFWRLLVKFYKERNYKRAVIFCLLIGCTVQYSTFFVKAYPQLSCNQMKMDLDINDENISHVDTLIKYCNCKVIDKKNNNLTKPQNWTSASLTGMKGIKPWLQFCRYLGMILGSIVIMRICGFPSLLLFGKRIANYRFFRKKVTLLSFILTIKLMVMLSIFLIWLYTTTYTDVYDTLAFSTFASFALGLCSASWILCILIVAEQFSLIDRIWWVLLAPNAYRFSELILMWYTGDVQVYGENKSMTILILGLIFIVIALLSSLGLNNNFEGDPLYLSNDKKLSDYDFMDKLSEIAKDRNSDSFLAKTNLALWVHFEKELREHYFYSSIYTLDSNDQLSYLGPQENEIAFKIYGKAGEDVKSWIAPEQLSLALTEKGIHKNLIVKILKSKNTEVRGGLFWYSGKHFEIQPYTKQKYCVVDLHMMNVEQLSKHKDILNNNVWGDAMQEQNLIEHFSDVECTWQKNDKTDENTILKNASKKLIQSFALYRIDAERYVPGRYFLHIIKPYTNECRLALILKTAVPLSDERLEELRAIVTFIELEQKNIELTSTFIELEQKNIELTSIKDHLEQLKNDQEKTIVRLSREEEHNRKAEMGWLKQNIQTLIARDINPNQTEEFRNLHGICMKVIDHLYEATAFNTYLLRWEAEEGDVQQEYHSEYLNLTASIEDVWAKIKEAYTFLRFPESAHRLLFKQFAEQSELFVHKQTVCLKNVPSTPLKIILFELLKNAAEKSNQYQPRVVVYLELIEDGQGLNIHIENSINVGVPIDLEQFDMNKPDHLGRAGIRSVKRYLRYINKQYDYDWDLKTKSTGTAFTVTIYVPQVCVLD